jgi:hypothetical protein
MVIVTFNSAWIKRDNNIIVTYRVNDNPLPEKHFPLRLVGSDLAKNEMVGMIAKIILYLKGLPTPAATEITNVAAPVVPATAAATEAEHLVNTGLVDRQLTVCEIDLRKIEVVKITADLPKKGK